MRQGFHSEYGPVAFRDRSTGGVVVVGSTLAGRGSDKTVEVEGGMSPLVDVDVSSDSHPFWTGAARRIDSEGRVQALERRYGRKA